MGWMRLEKDHFYFEKNFVLSALPQYSWQYSI